MSTRRDDARDEDLADLLDDLETTLGRLREELDERERGRERAGRDYRDRGDRGRPLPAPPGVGDVARFTSDYTIPTVIAVLEATIRALELVGSLLRLVDPEGSLDSGRARARDRGRSGLLDRSRTRPALDRTVDSVGGAALDGLDRALSELERALSEADLPRDPDARSVVEEARDLTAEIEARIADAEGRRTGDRGDRDRRDRGRDRGRGRAPDRDDDRRAGGGRRDRTDDGAVRIVVDEEAPDAGTDPDRAGDAGVDESTTDDGADDADEVAIDVEAELESIREEVGGRDDGDEPAADGTEAGPGAGAGTGTGPEDAGADPDPDRDADDEE